MQCQPASLSRCTLHAVPLSRVPSHAVQLSRGTCHAQSSDRTSSCGALCMQCSFCVDLVSSVQPLVVHFACSAAFAGTFTCSAALTGHLSCTVFRSYVVLRCTLHAVQLLRQSCQQCSASRGALCMQCRFCGYLHMQCSSHGALVMHSLQIVRRLAVHFACSAASASILSAVFSLSWCTLHAVPLLRVPSHAVQLSRGTCHAQSSDCTSSCGALCMQCSFCVDLVSSVQPLVVHFACSAAFAGTFTCSAALTGHLSCTVFRLYVVLWVWDILHHNSHTTLREYGHA